MKRCLAFGCAVLSLAGSLWASEAPSVRYEASAVYLLGTHEGSEVTEEAVRASAEGTFALLQDLFALRPYRERVITHYRATHPESSVAEEVLARALTWETRMTFSPEERFVTLSVQAPDPHVAADLANALMAAQQTFLEEQNGHTLDRCVGWLKEVITRQEAELETTERAIAKLQKEGTEDPLTLTFLKEERAHTEAALADLRLQVQDAEAALRAQALQIIPVMPAQADREHKVSQD